MSGVDYSVWSAVGDAGSAKGVDPDRRRPGSGIDVVIGILGLLLPGCGCAVYAGRALADGQLWQAVVVGLTGVGCLASLGSAEWLLILSWPAIAARVVFPRTALRFRLRALAPPRRLVARVVEACDLPPLTRSERCGLVWMLLARSVERGATWDDVDRWLDRRRSELTRTVARTAAGEATVHAVVDDLVWWSAWDRAIGEDGPPIWLWEAAGIDPGEAAAIVAGGQRPDRAMLASMAAVRGPQPRAGARPAAGATACANPDRRTLSP